VANYPPVGCTSIINYLKRHGYDAQFLNIDAKRLSDTQLLEYFQRERFDIVGISAVVSTGYAYTKKLAGLIKKGFASTRVMVGGNLAVIYDVLLKKCEVDVCVIGEGEKAMLGLVQYFDKHKTFLPVTPELKSIKGIACLDENKQLIYTGTGDLVEKDELPQVDYDILARDNDTRFYVSDSPGEYFNFDPRTNEPHRKGQKLAFILTSKGCVNSCTFCHRWIKGYRVLPIEKVIATVRDLKERYNVGYFAIGDECFGEDIRWLNEFILQIKPLDVLFSVAGARVTLLKKDPTIIRRLKEAGMVTIIFGVESGCDKILSIMDKKASCEDNLRAALACAQEDVYTEIQLVVGMPGENEETIQETIDFAVKATSKLPRFPRLSVNYLQALPGTPTYDFLQHYGLVGSSPDEVERYLLSVSDIDACKFSQYINVTESSLPRVMTWQKKIVFSARIAWLKEHQWKMPPSRLKFALKTSPLVYRCIDLLGETFWDLMAARNTIAIYGFSKALLIFLRISKDDRSPYMVPAQSLRKQMAQLNAAEKNCSTPGLSDI
jgi:radical SAM superfamily enzyme YgiQ (UPF0313 family)